MVLLHTNVLIIAILNNQSIYIILKIKQADYPPVFYINYCLYLYPVGATLCGRPFGLNVILRATTQARPYGVQFVLMKKIKKTLDFFGEMCYYTRVRCENSVISVAGLETATSAKQKFS